MSSDALWALQQAVFQHLTQDNTLPSLLSDGANSLYDHIPAMAGFPYVSFGESEQRIIETKTTTAYDIMMVFSTFSHSDGMKEVKQITAALSSALHHQNIPCDGYKIISTTEISTKIIRQGDGRTRQGEQVFKFIIEKI